MASEKVLRMIVRKIQANPELAGCVIGYRGGGQCRVIGYPSCVTPNSENVAVVIEEVYVPSAPRAAYRAASSPSIPAVSPRRFATNYSKLGPELIGTGASCGLAVVSGLGIAVGAASEVPTGGASTLLVIASWTGLVTGGIQCLNGLVRIGVALVDLEGDSLEAWDDNQIYATSMLLVDGIGIAGAASSLPFAVRELWAVTARLRAFRSLDLSFEALKRMNRVGRMQTLSKLFREASRTEAGAKELVTAARQAQIAARTMQRPGSLSVRHAETLREIISRATVHRMELALRDVLGNAAGMALSATPASLSGSGSGSVRHVIHLLDGGQPNF